jgi:hypothetical protein
MENIVENLRGEPARSNRHLNIQFRPDIEGLRAMAVCLIVLYHAGLPFLPGGFIYLCRGLRFRPVRQTSPYRSERCCPRYSEGKDTRKTYFGTQ